MNGCEVVDLVLTSTDATLQRREQNEAANVELVRRGLPDLVRTSGELVGDAIVWTNTCGGGTVEPGTL